MLVCCFDSFVTFGLGGVFVSVCLFWCLLVWFSILFKLSFSLCVWDGVWGCWGVKNGGPKIVKNGPRVWAFCKIEFPGIQKPVQILTQKSSFFRNPGNRGVGVIWLVWWGGWLFLFVFCFGWCGVG